MFFSAIVQLLLLAGGPSSVTLGAGECVDSHNSESHAEQQEVRAVDEELCADRKREDLRHQGGQYRLRYQCYELIPAKNQPVTFKL